MITRERAVEILADHGQEPCDTYDTGYTGESFDTVVGVKPEYHLMEVLGWLGYCCPFC